MFDYYYQPLCEVALTYTKDMMLAEDVVQDIFVTIWNRRQKVEINRNPKAYLITSLKNRIFELNRKKKLDINNEIELSTLESVAEINLEELLEQKVKIDKLYQSIRQLPKRCSTIFVLSKLEGRTHKEIASELDISVKTVENQITKAYKILREILKDFK